jgi:hypothetical protein
MAARMNREAEARWARAALGARTESDTDPDTEPGSSWDRAWSGLEQPPGAGAPSGFALQLERAWAAEVARAATPAPGGAGMRAAAAAALLLGIALGSGLAWRTEPDADAAAITDAEWPPATLSEDYLAALAALDEGGPAENVDREEP